MTPIETLAKMTEDPVPEPATFSSGAPLRIERFEDLRPGMRVEVYRRGRLADKASWEPGTVRSICESPTSTGDLKVYASIGIDTAGSSFVTAFIYARRWDRQDRHRIRRASDLVVDAPTVKTARQAAKSINFGQHPSFPPPVDGMMPAAILDVFTRIQREQLSPLIDDPKSPGFGQPRLTERQMRVARMMWTQRVKDHVEASDAERRRRERERVVVDDDRWEP